MESMRFIHWREELRDVTPTLIELTDEVLYGKVWTRTGLSPRDRSLITVAALVALNRLDQLPSHLERASNNGITKGQIVELVTHLAFYSGWPTAMSAGLVIKNFPFSENNSSPEKT
jgi:4-carboxymuconolactone decarboxylase